MHTLTRPDADQKPGRSALRNFVGLVGGFTVSGFPVAAMFLAPLAPVSRESQPPKYLNLLMMLAALGGAAALFSSLVNQVDYSMSSVASPIVIGFLLWGYCKATTGLPSAASVMFLTALSTVAAVFLTSNDPRIFTPEGAWKYGIAFPVTFALLYLAGVRSERRFWAYAVLGAAAALSLYLGFRSHALICLAVVVLVFARGRHIKRSQFISAAGAGVGLWALATFLPKAMADGHFGMELQARMLRQTADSTPLLLGGRTEIPLSLSAITEKPLFGWGNAQELDQGVISGGMNIASALGMGNPDMYLPFWVRPGGVVSLHSILFGSWVEGGLLAVLLPLALIVLFTAAMYVTGGRWAPVVILVCAQGIWDILFSPWAGNRIAIIALSAVIALWAIHENALAKRALDPSGESSASRPAIRRLPAGGRSSTYPHR